MNPRLVRWLTLLAASATSTFAAFTPGGSAFTKRVETSLLAEPKILATAVARLPYAREVKIEEVRGNWLRVRAGRDRGWIFGGNLADEKPSEVRGLDGLPLAASDTSATAAARPLAPGAVDYANRRGFAGAAEQLRWLEEQSDAITAEDVQAFLQSVRKGEYQ